MWKLSGSKSVVNGMALDSGSVSSKGSKKSKLAKKSKIKDECKHCTFYKGRQHEKAIKMEKIRIEQKLEELKLKSEIQLNKAK